MIVPYFLHSSDDDIHTILLYMETSIYNIKDMRMFMVVFFDVNLRKNVYGRLKYKLLQDIYGMIL